MPQLRIRLFSLPVLPPTTTMHPDDDDASNSEESYAPGRVKHCAAARAPAPAEPNAGDDTNDACGGGADAGGGGGGGADAGSGGGADGAAEDGIVLDVADLTSWQPTHGSTWITTRSSSRLTPCSASARFGPTLRWQ